MECEICGAPEAGYLILIEGAKLNVCSDCSNSGKLLRSPPAQEMRSDLGTTRHKEELEVVEGYGSIIANARKKLGLPIEVLAERINEKMSFLERIEHERTLPDEKVAHKLEKELGIKLLQGVVSTSGSASSQAKGGITLGDILEIERKGKR
ncbi:TPA: TIGR00270 family protein [Candidatus Micrarchaeota archaeon]|nr:TIGR00270 family protein [Candidatus Micrarchaeota archaeon]HIH29968.1 TIGR00270 family protein [Candidatus Micrarchaeota archaeon]